MARSPASRCRRAARSRRVERWGPSAAPIRTSHPTCTSRFVREAGPSTRSTGCARGDEEAGGSPRPTIGEEGGCEGERCREEGGDESEDRHEEGLREEACSEEACRSESCRIRYCREEECREAEARSQGAGDRHTQARVARGRGAEEPASTR